jgi:hypothetical protein
MLLEHKWSGFIAKVTSGLVPGDVNHHLECDLGMSEKILGFLQTPVLITAIIRFDCCRRDITKIEETWLDIHGGDIRAGKFEWYNANGEQSSRERKSIFISRTICSLAEENAR